MPIYEYIDKNNHRLMFTQPIDFDDEIICFACGEKMWRKPSSFAVTWTGGKPSEENDGKQGTDE